MKRAYKIVSLVVLLQVLVLTNQACQEAFKPVASSESNGSSHEDQSGGYIETPGGGMVEIVESKTTRLIASEEILPSLVSVVGTGVPSSTTVARFDRYRPLLTDTGETSAVNAPLAMSILNIGGEVCADLISAESRMPAAERRIFSRWDFTKGSELLQPAAVDESVRKLARSAWGRNEKAEELKIISDAVVSIRGPTTQDTTASAMLICASILASIDTQKR